jgi:cation diffusion facilitator family transporter
VTLPARLQQPASAVDAAADALRHGHAFLGADHARNARRVRAVLAVSLLAMTVEVGFGLRLHSMALLGEGLHLCSHAGVFLAASWAYRFASRHIDDARFSFGPGKVGDLAGFGGAILLGVVAVTLAGESLSSLVQPQAVDVGPAILVAIFGLVVSLLSAGLLHGGADASHAGRDLTLRAAYLHLLGDVLVSLLALAGLVGVRLFGWTWMDAAAGLAGAAVVARFALMLAREAGGRLLDAGADPQLLAAVRARLERRGDAVCDLHVWRLAPGHLAAIVSVASPDPLPVDAYRQAIAEVHGFSHLTVEVHGLAA